MTNPVGPDPLPPWWKGIWGIGIFVLVAVLLAGGILWLIQPDDDHCAPGVPDLYWAGSGSERECVGFTNEVAYAFDRPELKDITDRIAAENKRVREESEKNDIRDTVPYVRIALLGPFAASANSSMSLEQIKASLEGAYTAQCRANQCPNLKGHDELGISGKGPQIQLLIANEGRNQTHWRPVVQRLTDLTGGEHPMVAVAGMGISVQETQDAAAFLAEKEIPAIGAVLTADSLKAKTLFNVSPANSEYATAAREYLDNSLSAGSTHLRPTGHTGHLVYDTRKDTGDMYVQSLYESFKDKFNDYIAPRPGSSSVRETGFTGATGAEPEGVRVFSTVRENICLAKDDVILYAGRDTDLPELVKELGHRGSCKHDDPITILTATAGTYGQTEETRKELEDAQVTLVRASATASTQWIADKTGQPTEFPRFQKSFEILKFEDPDLRDGYAIMHHDAVLTAILATRSFTAGTSTKAPPVAPNHHDVLNQIKNMNQANQAALASGTVSFDNNSCGWPSGKPILMLTFPAIPDNPLPPKPNYITPHHPACQS